MKQNITLSLSELLCIVSIVAFGMGAMINASQSWMLPIVLCGQMLVLIGLIIFCFHQLRSTRVFALSFLLVAYGLPLSHFDQPIEYAFGSMYGWIFPDSAENVDPFAGPAIRYRPGNVPNGFVPYAPRTIVPASTYYPEQPQSMRAVPIRYNFIQIGKIFSLLLLGYISAILARGLSGGESRNERVV